MVGAPGFSPAKAPLFFVILSAFFALSIYAFFT